MLKTPAPITNRTNWIRPVENPQFALRPGMFVDVEFPITIPPTINIPVDAIMDAGLSKTVFIDKKGTKKKPALNKLKKRMERAFAEISAACDAGSLPDGGLVAAFYEDCEALTLQESGINPYLEESLQAVRLLAEAVAGGDTQRARDAVERFRYIQSESESMNPEEKK